MRKRIITIFMAACAFMTLAACANEGGAPISSESSEAASSEASSEVSSEAASSEGSSAETKDTASTEHPETEEPAAAPEIWSPAIVQRQVMHDEGSICGVAYIGYTDEATMVQDCKDIFYNSVYAEDFEYITDIPDENVIDTGAAYELYLIIPCDENASVSVSELLFTEENDFSGSEGELLYSSETGAPFLLKCNHSDIMPNTVISITDSSGKNVKWSPSLSLKDGSVSRYDAEDDIYDFTHYTYNETYECYSPDIN